MSHSKTTPTSPLTPRPHPRTQSLPTTSTNTTRPRCLPYTFPPTALPPSKTAPTRPPATVQVAAARQLPSPSMVPVTALVLVAAASSTAAARLAVGVIASRLLNSTPTHHLCLSVALLPNTAGTGPVKQPLPPRTTRQSRCLRRCSRWL
jgi:hypothetical protein